MSLNHSVDHRLCPHPQSRPSPQAVDATRCANSCQVFGQGARPAHSAAHATHPVEARPPLTCICEGTAVGLVANRRRRGGTTAFLGLPCARCAPLALHAREWASARARFFCPSASLAGQTPAMQGDLHPHARASDTRHQPRSGAGGRAQAASGRTERPPSRSLFDVARCFFLFRLREGGPLRATPGPAEPTMKRPVRPTDRTSQCVLPVRGRRGARAGGRRPPEGAPGVRATIGWAVV